MITITCDKCRRKIGDTEGYVTVDLCVPVGEGRLDNLKLELHASCAKSLMALIRANTVSQPVGVDA